jgi:D-alanine-D-alanine ligase-like ATP-grasp enzyme
MAKTRMGWDPRPLTHPSSRRLQSTLKEHWIVLQTVSLPLYPLFVKPLHYGTSIGVHESSRVEDHQALTVACLHVLQTYHQPALIEEYLPGREFTVGIAGTGDGARAIGVDEVKERLYFNLHKPVQCTLVYEYGDGENF